MIDWSLTVPAATRAAEARALLAGRIKARRDAAIATGLEVAGIAVATDETSQNRIAGAALAALVDPGLRVQWKLPSGGFVTLEATQILAIAGAVRAHVQACFDREAVLLAVLEAGETPALEEGWPGQPAPGSASA